MPAERHYRDARITEIYEVGHTGAPARACPRRLRIMWQRMWVAERLREREREREGERGQGEGCLVEGETRERPKARGRVNRQGGLVRERPG